MSPCILSPDNDNVSNEAQPITGGQSQGIAAQEPKRKKAKSRPASASEGCNLTTVNQSPCDNFRLQPVNQSPCDNFRLQPVNQSPCDNFRLQPDSEPVSL
ncbi:hypothetical protein ACOMHN_030599 [Nucella lapillus]